MQIAKQAFQASRLKFETKSTLIANLELLVRLATIVALSLMRFEPSFKMSKPEIIKPIKSST